MDDGYVLHTDRRWLAYQARHRTGQFVGYMRGPRGGLVRFNGGEFLAFLIGNKTPHEVAAVATYIRSKVVTLEEAWNEYGEALGASTRQQFFDLAPIKNSTPRSFTAVLEAENFRPVMPPISVAELGIPDKKSAARGWYISTDETAFALERLSGARPQLEDAAFQEGDRTLRRHLRIERNPYVVALAKRQWREANSDLSCEVCGFSFKCRYGVIGDGFVEAHHRTPLGELEDAVGTQTKVSDLAPVCANCHRMLHTDGGRSIAELRSLLL